jgi:hypothetical protein
MTGAEGNDSFPPAEGPRLAWADLPAKVRAAVEAELGVQIVSASSRRGGFSPGLASKLVAEDGREIFLKVVLASVNRESVAIHRREARIAAALPRVPEIPEFLWSLDDGGFVALAFEYVDGATPPLPWLRTDLERVLGALERLSDALTPSPIEVESAADELAPALSRWQTADVAELARLPSAWRDRLDDLVDLERRWPEAASGKSLLHLDVRADNVLLTSDRVHFVDWPWAAVGARWLDVVGMLPSVVMQGGPAPEDVWDAHPWRAGVDDDAVDCFLAAFAGMLTIGGMQPAPPGLPTLRAFQAVQGRHARAWLARRRGWIDAVETPALLPQ